MSASELWNVGLAAALAVAVAYSLSSRLARRRYVREVERLAFHDALTGLPNRTLFLDRAGFAFAHARRDDTSVAVVYLDLDRFKLVNDTYGHDAGDEVLRTVAKRLRQQLREVDTVARMGGDEFTLLMPGIRNDADLDTVAAKLASLFRTPMQIGGHDLVVTASIGISVFPRDATDSEALLTRADAAMYRVKERGGDSAQIFAPGLELYRGDELQLESRLRRAIAKQEFVLHYQPRLDFAQKRIVAFEALLRWNDPERGLVAPSEFLPAADASGLMIPIGEWVLHSACRQVRTWHDAGSGPVIVSVNLSSRQFHHRDLVSTVARVLREEDVQARFLELEIEERTVMQHAEASVAILERLKSLRVRVLVSHFAAGYSSLSHLRRFAIDGLKLDRSILSGATPDRPLATAALHLAKALRLKVIGEGVETAEAAAFLRAEQCDGIQGYLVSAPIPALECGSFLSMPAPAMP